MNSLNPQLVFPMCAMFILSLVSLSIMFHFRKQAVKSGQLRMSFFRNQSEGVKPESMAKADRHYINLFESPVLFYTASVLGLILGIQSNTLVVFAWLFVVARIAQAFVHLTSNSLRTRPLVFAASWVCMIVMWGIVFTHTLALVS